MTEKRDSAWYYYVCACQASNNPCETHHRRPDGSLPDAMPDDWLETYEAPGPPGLTDEFKAQ